MNPGTASNFRVADLHAELYDAILAILFYFLEGCNAPNTRWKVI